MKRNFIQYSHCLHYLSPIPTKPKWMELKSHVGDLTPIPPTTRCEKIIQFRVEWLTVYVCAGTVLVYEYISLSVGPSCWITNSFISLKACVSGCVWTARTVHTNQRIIRFVHVHLYVWISLGKISHSGH